MKVILICGRLCSGKTTYAKALCSERRAVLLSSDELISALFHPRENEYHDRIIEAVHGYLLQKSLEILRADASVILDWGFWTGRDRERVSAFYREQGIETEWHYLNIDQDAWLWRIEKRNRKVLQGASTDYFVDEGLFRKADLLFETPERSVIDVWLDIKMTNFEGML